MKTGCVGVGGAAAMEDKEESGGEKKGPWTPEEDESLTRYVTCHGERHWSLVAKSSGLKRTGKSCRLRWLNYLKPGIKRGDLTFEEQLKILHLHSQLGNKWSKIAASLPGRTDNEIKNYWRTRVQKHARQLNMDSNSQSFNHAIQCLYVPRLLERIEQNSTNLTSLNCEGLSTYCPTMLASHINKAETPCSHTSFFGDTLQPIITGASFANGTTVNNGKGSSLAAENGYYVDSSKYDDMGSGSMSAAYDSLFDCHVASEDWLWDNMAEDDIWGFSELW